MPFYIGLDSSTQSLTAVVIEVSAGRRRVVFHHSLRFDEAFPAYGTRNGVIPDADPLVKRSSPVLWAEALEALMAVLSRQQEFPLSEVRAIAGSGQQHGSIYLGAAARTALANLDARRPLVEQLGGIFTRELAPIWMDASTGSQCESITRDVGGEGVLASLTGSRAFKRFTGPQIRKFFEEDPEGYESTDCIHLVSSYMASLLAGQHAPLDPGDASGMNLMDLARKNWAAAALEATAPGLLAKLPPIRDSWTVVGPLSKCWVERFGFPAATKVIAWSGDNPCSMIGVGIVKPGSVAISLGTSDTLFGYMPVPRVDPAGEGHVFASPTGEFMSLVCFVNGSLARDEIRCAYGLDWDGFSRALRETPPGNHGSVLLPWFLPEINPSVEAVGPRRYELDPVDGRANVRAVVEAQMMSMAIHSAWMGVRTETIHATGGASCNREILRVMADVHNAEVYQFEVEDSAALGAALRAYHADEVSERRPPSWDDVIRGFTEPVRGSRIAPNAAHVEVYDELKRIYAACETHALRGGNDPAPSIRAFRARHGG